MPKVHGQCARPLGPTKCLTLCQISVGSSRPLQGQANGPSPAVSIHVCRKRQGKKQSKQWRTLPAHISVEKKEEGCWPSVCTPFPCCLHSRLLSPPLMCATSYAGSEQLLCIQSCLVHLLRPPLFAWIPAAYDLWEDLPCSLALAVRTLTFAPSPLFRSTCRLLIFASYAVVSAVQALKAAAVASTPSAAPSGGQHKKSSRASTNSSASASRASSSGGDEDSSSEEVCLQHAGVQLSVFRVVRF
eukprot:1157474-Pelagomonas_calceolata.AAC.5